jgi:hypothetical protein
MRCRAVLVSDGHMRLDLVLTCHIKHDDADNDQQHQAKRLPQAPEVPPNSVQHLHEFVALVPSAPKLLLLAVAEGQACGYLAKVLAEEALVSWSEARVAFDLGTSCLGGSPGDIMRRAAVGREGAGAPAGIVGCVQAGTRPSAGAG